MPSPQYLPAIKERSRKGRIEKSAGHLKLATVHALTCHILVLLLLSLLLQILVSGKFGCQKCCHPEQIEDQ